MKLALLLVCAVLAGCISAKVLSSSPRSVVVRAGDLDYAVAQKLADAECSKHRRFAQMAARPGPYTAEFVFDCVN